MGKTLRHPLHNQQFTRLADGSVEVVDLDTQARGVFDGDTAQWVSGDVRYADEQLVRWVGSPAHADPSDTGPGMSDDTVHRAD